MELYLASASPRRRDLLAQLGVPFHVLPPDVPETLQAGEPPEAAALRLARAKAGAVAAQLASGIVLAADTLVAVDSKVLGKPGRAEDMELHLRLLSGRTHRVVTALALVDVANGRSAHGVEVTEVDFDRLDEDAIRWYVASGEGYDKAGSYGYQGLASVLIRGIRGCYFNVVGLPLRRLKSLLSELGYDLLEHAGLFGGHR